MSVSLIFPYFPSMSVDRQTLKPAVPISDAVSHSTHHNTSQLTPGGKRPQIDGRGHVSEACGACSIRSHQQVAAVGERIHIIGDDWGRCRSSVVLIEHRRVPRTDVGFENRHGSHLGPVTRPHVGQHPRYGHNQPRVTLSVSPARTL